MKARLLILLLGAVACGGTESSGYSCDQRSANKACLEYSGATEYISAYKSACTSPGVWAETACPKDQQIGGCRQSEAGNSFTTWFYTGGPYDSTTIQSACTAPSSFVAP